MFLFLPQKKSAILDMEVPMKRWTALFSLLVVLVSLSMVSCDAMFSTNVFAKLTHPTPSAAELAAKTPSEMQDYVSSTENMNQLADDPDLKDAALTALGYGEAQTPPASALTPDEQLAAIVAAEIFIQTVPDAAGLSASVLGALAGGSALSSASESDIASFIESVLPAGIQDGVAPGAPMPADFAAMIEAFISANDAYEALGQGLVDGGGGYAAGLDLTSSEKADIAVNAVISGLVAAVVPASGTAAEALWLALTDPAGASSYITVPSTAIDDLTSGAGPIASLVGASSIGAMF
jgi:hypothetical protein